MNQHSVATIKQHALACSKVFNALNVANVSTQCVRDTHNSKKHTKNTKKDIMLTAWIGMFII